MKIAITSKSNSLNSSMDPRFGRAEWMAVYDSQEKKTEFHNNEAKEQQSGSGPKTAQLLADLGVEKIFSGDFGPKAKKVLESLGIEMVVLKDEQPIENIIKNFK